MIDTFFTSDIHKKLSWFKSSTFSLPWNHTGHMQTYFMFGFMFTQNRTTTDIFHLNKYSRLSHLKYDHKAIIWAWYKTVLCFWWKFIVLVNLNTFVCLYTEQTWRVSDTSHCSYILCSLWYISKAIEMIWDRTFVAGYELIIHCSWICQ